MTTLIELPKPPPLSKARRYLVGGGLCFFVLVAAVLAGRYSLPARVVETVKVETKVETKVEWRDRVVEKRVEGPVRVVTRVVTAPSGERTEERVEEHGPVVTDRDIHAEGGSASMALASSESYKLTENPRPGWRVSVAAGWNPNRLSLDPSVYDLRVERRVFGTLWLGAFARTDKTGGLSLAMEF
jgi:hypothetical protein